MVVPHDESALEKKATSNVIELDFDIEGGQYRGVVLLGSEGVSYKPIIDSGSWETWFANDNDWTDHSTTLVNLTKPFSVNYVGSGNPATGFFVKDTIEFTNAKSAGFEFGILNNPPWFPQGILAIARLQGSDHDTLPYHLKTTGQVERTVASLYYSKLQNKGELTFGGYDRAKVGSGWTSHADPVTFKVPVVKSHVDGVDYFPEHGDYPIVVDSGAWGSLFPRAVVEPLATSLNLKIDGNQYKGPCGTYEGQFLITLGNLTLEFDKLELVTELTNNGNCVATLGFKGAEYSNNLTLIGTDILNKVVTVFDYENGVVSMAKLNDTPEEDVVFLKEGQSI